MRLVIVKSSNQLWFVNFIFLITVSSCWAYVGVHGMWAFILRRLYQKDSPRTSPVSNMPEKVEPKTVPPCLHLIALQLFYCFCTRASSPTLPPV